MIAFEQFFADRDVVERSAPGRVNVLGAHTDYNDGFALAMATPMRTKVAVAASGDDAFHIYSCNLADGVILGRHSRLASGYGRYLEGCIRLLEQLGHDLPPLRVYVRSDLPIGAGLSSSAALEVATLRALRAFLDLSLSDIELAQMAQIAERTYAGVHCGILDQMAASFCEPGQMLFLDARTLAARPSELPPQSEVLVVDTGIARTLEASPYNRRRAECTIAARAMGVESLRDAASDAPLDHLDALLQRRVRHVLSLIRERACAARS